MAWTDLKQNWVDGDDFSAANMNAITSALNVLMGDLVTAATAAGETTGSSSWVDLTTVTDTVSATIGSSGVALVQVSATAAYSSGSGGSPGLSFAASGANTIAAGVWIGCNLSLSPSGLFLLQNLAPGLTTFKQKYATVAGGTGAFTYSNRRISVLPFP